MAVEPSGNSREPKIVFIDVAEEFEEVKTKLLKATKDRINEISAARVFYIVKCNDTEFKASGHIKWDKNPALNEVILEKGINKVTALALASTSKNPTTIHRICILWFAFAKDKDGNLIHFQGKRATFIENGEKNIDAYVNSSRNNSYLVEDVSDSIRSACLNDERPAIKEITDFIVGFKQPLTKTIAEA